jgi:NADPH-dependent curcumin reductase CurA
MRGWVSAVANYSEPVALGAVMRSLAVGRVEESRSSDFHPGEYLTGMFGWQDYAVVDAEAIERKVGGSGLPISTSLGVLGLNGLTAYFALLEIGQPKAGETAVVSTAAGAVGSYPREIPVLLNDSENAKDDHNSYRCLITRRVFYVIPTVPRSIFQKTLLLYRSPLVMR